MSERIEVAGIRRSAAEWNELLAWIAEPWREAPRGVYLSCAQLLCNRYAPHAPGYGGSEGAQLALRIIEQIRDAVEPWREVECQHIEPGTRGRYRSIPGRVMQNREFAADDGSMFRLLSECDLVEVRRPRKPALTLREVKAGSTVESEDGSRVFVYDLAVAHLGHRFVSDVESPHVLASWPLDTPVELVPEADS